MTNLILHSGIFLLFFFHCSVLVYAWYQLTLCVFPFFYFYQVLNHIHVFFWFTFRDCSCCAQSIAILFLRHPIPSCLSMEGKHHMTTKMPTYLMHRCQHSSQTSSSTTMLLGFLNWMRLLPTINVQCEVKKRFT